MTATDESVDEKLSDSAKRSYEAKPESITNNITTTLCSNITEEIDDFKWVSHSLRLLFLSSLASLKKRVNLIWGKSFELWLCFARYPHSLAFTLCIVSTTCVRVYVCVLFHTCFRAAHKKLRHFSKLFNPLVTHTLVHCTTLTIHLYLSRLSATIRLLFGVNQNEERKIIKK